jgi:hypothetical protein
MRVGEIGDLVQEWVGVHGEEIPGYCGAYLFGSIATLPPDAPLATYRDVDVIVVLDSGTKPTDANLEVLYKGLMLEVGFIGLDEHRDAEAILARPDRAGNFAHTRILADPTGVLMPLQQEVRRSYADRRWVVARCDAEKQALVESLDAMSDPPIPLLRLLALVGVMFGMAGLVAVARLEIPTSRRALIRLKQQLQQEARADLYAEALDVCGVTGMEVAEVKAYHRDLLSAFDRAAQVKRTVVPYGFKVEPHTRPYTNEAIAELIDEGYHREAAFYLALPYGAVNAIIQNDAPEEERAAVQAGFDRLLASLDLTTPAQWPRRVQRARALASQVCGVADSRLAVP